METPQRYWSGLYWDGLDPEQIGAVSLVDVSAEDDPVIDAVLAEVRRRVQAGGERLDEYYISLLEMQAEGRDEAADGAIAPSASSGSSSEAFPASGTTSTAAGASLSLASSPVSACGGDCLVVRLWHSAVFLGARETALGNPGARCRDWHFSPTHGTFRHQLALEDTDAIMDAQEHE